MHQKYMDQNAWWGTQLDGGQRNYVLALPAGRPDFEKEMDRPVPFARFARTSGLFFFHQS